MSLFVSRQMNPFEKINMQGKNPKHSPINKHINSLNNIIANSNVLYGKIKVLMQKLLKNHHYLHKGFR